MVLFFLQKHGIFPFLLLLAGCSSLYEPALLPENLVWQEKLLKAVERASRAQEKLAMLEQARHPRLVSERVDLKDVPEALRQLLSLSWQGPLEPAVRKVAEKIGYAFKVVGFSPAIPVIVTLNAHDQAAVMVLREMGHQCRGRADIHVDASAKTIEVYYAPRRY